MSEHTSYILGAIAAVLAAAKPVVVAVKWLIEKVEHRGEERYIAKVKDEFIVDVAQNHLPHIETSLELIAGHMGIEIPEAPPIKYLPFDPNHK